MTGFPGVSLRKGGSQVGQPANRSSLSPTTVALGPGTVATSTVHIASSCNAPLSDTLRVYPPDQTAYVDVPAVVRACPATVDPVVRG